MTHVFKFTAYLERSDTEIEVEVTYSASPSIAATWEQPAEGGEIEIISVKANGAEFVTTLSEDDRLYDLACERSVEDWADYEDGAAEYRADLARDERMIRDFQS